MDRDISENWAVPERLTMENSYLVAEIVKGRRHRVFLFEMEGKESLEDVVKKNFGDEVQIAQRRTPTPEEFILMKRGMRS